MITKGFEEDKGEGSGLLWILAVSAKPRRNTKQLPLTSAILAMKEPTKNSLDTPDESILQYAGEL